MLKMIAVAAGLCLATGVRGEITPPSLDPAVKPADDFYHYVNDAWLKTTPIPAEYSHWGTLDALRQASLEELHLLVERASAQGNDASPIEQKVGDFYASGMDEAAANDAGTLPLAFEFERIAALQTPADVLGEIGHLHTLGVSAGFQFASAPDAKDSDRDIAEVRQGGLGLPEREYYFRDDEKSRNLRVEYIAHIDRMFLFLGDMDANAQAGAFAVMHLETALARGSLSQAALRNPDASYHKVTIPAAGALVPGLDWPAYFSKAGAPAFDEFNLAHPDFFRAFAAALAQTPVGDWKSYLRWNVIHAFAPYLGDSFVEENFRFYGAVLTGAKKIQPRWERVVMTIDGSIGEALGQLYVADYFPPESRAPVLKIVGNLRAALRERLQALDWMDAPTRTQALAKLDALAVKIGYPDTWRDYSALTIDRGPYVLNVLKSNAFGVRSDLRKIGQPVDKAGWQMTPATVSAAYDSSRNEIVLPAAILQPPLFDPKADDAVNYGAIGAVVGREMTRGFDEMGRHYDENGNLADWWTAESANRFKERAAGIVRQFNAYLVYPDLHVNGELTEGENIADLGGATLASAALEKALAGQPRASIGGFTPEQRFFISYASLWKTKYRAPTLRLLVSTDPHSPGEFRCNGPLSNLDEFAAAFAVPAGAPMRQAPGKQVVIW